MTDHPLVTDYLRRLGQAAAYAPADGRDLLLDEVAAHLRATVPLNATDERARRLLEEFGSPDDLVAEAFGAARAPAMVTGEPLVAEVFGAATARGTTTGRRRWLRWSGVAAAVVAVAAFVLTLVVPELRAEQEAAPGSAVTPLAVSLLQPGPRTTEGRDYAEYTRRLQDLPPLPPGAVYPDGVRPRPEPTEPVVIETGGGAVAAEFTWLCFWETEYLDAHDADAFERVLEAEEALRSWLDYTSFPPGSAQGWAQNVLVPLSFDNPSGVRDDQPQVCRQADLEIP